MIYNKVNSRTYQSQFKKKFENFLNKAPILASMIITPESVQVVHENTGKKYVFPWDYSKDVKQFIFEIKQTLLVHYPRLVRTEINEVKLTPDEQANLIAEGKYNPENVPLVQEQRRKVIYRIDKVIVPQDIFLLVNEETGQVSRYKMNKSCVYFLKSYRSGKFKTIEEASEFFFAKSTFLNYIVPKKADSDEAGEDFTGAEQVSNSA